MGQNYFIVGIDGLRTDKQVRFVNEYVIDSNGTKAAIRAGYSEATAYSIAHELLSKPEIQLAIDRRKEQLAAASSITVEMIVAEIFKVATSDMPTCCRYCWGINHGYQWTEKEYTRACNDAVSRSEAIPDIGGMFGYKKSRGPHPDCPECKGIGIPSNVTLKPQEKLKAFELLGKYKAMFTERSELSGPGGGPLQLQPVNAPAREIPTAQIEAELISRGLLLEAK